MSFKKWLKSYVGIKKIGHLTDYKYNMNITFHEFLIQDFRGGRRTIFTPCNNTVTQWEL
jgi:hypothetical protein